MAKKKEPKKAKWDKKALRGALEKVDGVNEEIVNHAIQYGVPDDAYSVQTFYRVTDQTARAIIEAFKAARGAKGD